MSEPPQALPPRPTLTPLFVEESHERFSEITLSDGAVIMAKIVVTQAYRSDQLDELGRPIYTFHATQPIFILKSCPQELCAKKS